MRVPFRSGLCRVRRAMVSCTLGALLATSFSGVAAEAPAGAGGATTASPLAITSGGRTGFTRLDPVVTGLGFTNRLSDGGAASNQIRLNGSGVALGDVDRDGRLDIFLAGLETPNRLFRNLGRWRFEAVETSPAIAMPGSYSSGAVFADVDGDGDADLLVNALGEGTRLFLNDGTGRFVEKADAGLMRRGGACSMALADIDGDGDLDLYVANYRTQTVRTTGIPMVTVNGKRTIPPQLKDELELTPEGRVLEHGEPDLLYLNQGGARFQVESWTQGRFLDEDGRPLAKIPRDWGLAAAFRDVNQDGLPDLYVCNDFHSEDRLWLNVGGGRFRAAPRLALRHSATFSMSVDFADVNRDGWDDFFVSDMLDRDRTRRMHQVAAMSPWVATVGVFEDRPQYGQNVLQMNRGDGSYAELAAMAGLDRSGWTWGVAFVDVDLDGYEDLLMTTGHLFNTQDLDAAARIERLGPYRRDQIPGKLLGYPKVAWPKLAFRNEGGLRFSEVGADWGFADAGVSHGMALGDLDGDGDLDVVVNDLNRAAGVYRNESPAARVLVELRGSSPNTDGVGARVSLVAEGMMQSQEIQSGSRYLSGDAAQRVFAWPARAATASLVVDWRDGIRQVVTGIRPNQRWVVAPPAESLGSVRNAARRPLLPDDAAWFEDASARLRHQHVENTFDDFQRQPLLPLKLSQPGPALAWCDVNRDGIDDLAVGAGVGGGVSVALGQPDGGFLNLTNAHSAVALARDVTGLLTVPGATDRLWVASSNYEDGHTNGIAVREWSPATGVGKDILPDLPSAVGVLALADADGDGDLDAFVGGRVVSGRYPAPASSMLLLRDADRWVPDAAARELLSGVGLVTGAAWTDLDLDGLPELVLACEWGAVRILHRRGTAWAWWDPEVRSGETLLRLSRWTGRWSSLATGDLDADGRTDLVLGNWGLNQSARAGWNRPVRMYYGDFDESGSLDLIEAAYDRVLGTEMPERDLVSFQQAVPSLVARFPSHTEFARASVGELLGDWKPRARMVEAVTLESYVMLNRGQTWERVPLPAAAQATPAMGAVVADFDGDGDEDVFLAQNFFAVHALAVRQDAGLGVILINDGNGRFEGMSTGVSGVVVPGESRSAAVADYDQDGRVDLAVSQNGAATRLFRNLRAVPGVRVGVKGPAGNPTGVGVRLRWRRGEGDGVVREIQAGGGGLNQNSSWVVMTPAPEKAAELEVVWPGGRVERVAIAAGQKSVLVTAP